MRERRERLAGLVVAFFIVTWTLARCLWVRSPQPWIDLLEGVEARLDQEGQRDTWGDRLNEPAPS